MNYDKNLLSAIKLAAIWPGDANLKRNSNWRHLFANDIRARSISGIILLFYLFLCFLIKSSGYGKVIFFLKFPDCVFALGANEPIGGSARMSNVVDIGEKL